MHALCKWVKKDIRPNQRQTDKFQIVAPGHAEEQTPYLNANLYKLTQNSTQHIQCVYYCLTYLMLYTYCIRCKQ